MPKPAAQTTTTRPVRQSSLPGCSLNCRWALNQVCEILGYQWFRVFRIPSLIASVTVESYHFMYDKKYKIEL